MRSEVSFWEGPEMLLHLDSVESVGKGDLAPLEVGDQRERERESYNNRELDCD